MNKSMAPEKPVVIFYLIANYIFVLAMPIWILPLFIYDNIKNPTTMARECLKGQRPWWKS